MNLRPVGPLVLRGGATGVNLLLSVIIAARWPGDSVARYFEYISLSIIGSSFLSLGLPRHLLIHGAAGGRAARRLTLGWEVQALRLVLSLGFVAAIAVTILRRYLGLLHVSATEVEVAAIGGTCFALTRLAGDSLRILGRYSTSVVVERLSYSTVLVLGASLSATDPASIPKLVAEAFVISSVFALVTAGWAWSREEPLRHFRPVPFPKNGWSTQFLIQCGEIATNRVPYVLVPWLVIRDQNAVTVFLLIAGAFASVRVGLTTYFGERFAADRSRRPAVRFRRFAESARHTTVFSALLGIALIIAMPLVMKVYGLHGFATSFRIAVALVTFAAVFGLPDQFLIASEVGRLAVAQQVIAIILTVVLFVAAAGSPGVTVGFVALAQLLTQVVGLWMVTRLALGMRFGEVHRMLWQLQRRPRSP